MRNQISEKCLETIYQKYLKLLAEADNEQKVVEILRILEKINRKLDKA